MVRSLIFILGYIVLAMIFYSWIKVAGKDENLGGRK